MSKILQSDLKVKSISGLLDNSCPSKDPDSDDYSEIVIVTDKGTFVIRGCVMCHVLSFKQIEG